MKPLVSGPILVLLSANVLWQIWNDEWVFASEEVWLFGRPGRSPWTEVHIWDPAEKTLDLFLGLSRPSCYTKWRKCGCLFFETRLFFVEHHSKLALFVMHIRSWSLCVIFALLLKIDVFAKKKFKYLLMFYFRVMLEIPNSFTKITYQIMWRTPPKYHITCHICHIIYCIIL